MSGPAASGESVIHRPVEREGGPGGAGAARRRTELFRAIERLEQASSIGAAESADRTASVHRALAALRDAFEAHAQAVQEPGGLFEQILDQAPYLALQLSRLGQEHRDIAAALAAEATTLTGSQQRPDAAAADMRSRMRELSSRVVRAIEGENDMIWQAFELDLGGG